MKIQLLSLAAQYGKIRKEVLREIVKVCDSQRYILGENVEGLESEIAAYCGVRYAVAVASGSDAILLGLEAAGVKAGDRVVTTPYTFFSTAGSISRLGAVPEFVDIDPKTYNICPEKIRALLKNKRSRQRKAILPVHLYGQSADMTEINSIADDYGLKTIEDAAQAIGASHRGKRAGSMGTLGCISFYPSKNLGSFGDGGMVTTDDESIMNTIMMLRVHGSKRRYYHELVGINSRLDELQAVVLRVKLKYLKHWTEKRIENAMLYGKLFKESGLLARVGTPVVMEGNKSVFNQYVIRVKERDALKRHLEEKGVGTEIYYPVPLHLQRCFKGLGYKKGDFPESEMAAAQTLALPVYPELKKKEIRCVVEAIAGFYSRQ